MTYKIPEQDIASYRRDGYIVFKRIIPPSLITDLRVQAEKAAAIVRAKDPQAQRIQPVGSYADQLDMKPFQDFAQLPAINDALQQVTTPEHYYGKLDVLGILLEPSKDAWCTSWHRDISLESSKLSLEDFEELIYDWNTAHQINSPLYDDECTWYVPGSHLRSFDLPGETALIQQPKEIGVGWPGQKQQGADAITRELSCDKYTRAMPGAVQLRLMAGDFALYRASGWHTGNYVPYKRRATLHDAVFNPRHEIWWRNWGKGIRTPWRQKPPTT